MINIILCDGDNLEREQLLGYIRRYSDEKDLSLRVVGCIDWGELAGHLKKGKWDLVIIAQDGVDGMDTITSVLSLEGNIVWFSDLDFGVQAYRLCVTYFSKKPVSYHKMERALERCMPCGNCNNKERSANEISEEIF